MSTVVKMRRRPSGLRLAAAEEVRALMGRRRMSQTALADVLGVTQTQVSKRLRGVIPFDIDEIERLAEYFGVDPADLLGSSGRRPSGPGQPSVSSGWSRRKAGRAVAVRSWEHATGLIPTAA